MICAYLEPFRGIFLIGTCAADLAITHWGCDGASTILVPVKLFQEVPGDDLVAQALGLYIFVLGETQFISTFKACVDANQSSQYWFEDNLHLKVIARRLEVIPDDFC